MNAIVTESGNGLPSVGDYVHGDDGNLYRITATGGRIETGRRAGAGNWMHVEVEPAEWEDCAEEDEFPALVTIAEDAP